MLVLPVSGSLLRVSCRIAAVPRLTFDGHLPLLEPPNYAELLTDGGHGLTTAC